MDGVQVIFTYKAILTVTEKMLKAAQANKNIQRISLEVKKYMKGFPLP